MTPLAPEVPLDDNMMAPVVPLDDTMIALDVLAEESSLKVTSLRININAHSTLRPRNVGPNIF